MNKNICKIKNPDKWSIELISNHICILQYDKRKQYSFLRINPGTILIDGINIVGNKTYIGTYLIAFKTETIINNEKYVNYESAVKEILHEFQY